MPVFLIRAIQLILSLSLLVVIHEFGHFTMARLFGVRVEKYYMFFNPQFSILRFKKIRGKWHLKWFSKNVEEPLLPELDEYGDPKTDKKGRPLYRPMTDEELAALPEDDWRRYPETTEWGIGWLPLGGYCRICGMVDETTSAGMLRAEPKPWEYRAQKAWKRMLIIVGGVLFNLIGAVVIYAGILAKWGQEYVPMTSTEMGMQYTELMQEQGFRNGDRILSIGNLVPETSGDAVEALVIDGERQVTVVRGGDTLTIDMPADFAQQVLESGAAGLFEYRFPFVVTDVMGGSVAAAAGLQAGDSLVGMAGVATLAFQDVQEQLTAHAGEEVEIAFVRHDSLMNTTARLGDDGKLGVYFRSPADLLTTCRREYSFWQAIPAGAKLGWETLAGYVKQFKLVFTKAGAKQLGGFGAIGKMFPAMWSWPVFWSMTAFLSIILAFMNILPIPALDGGYVVFLIYEMITGRKPSDRFMENTTTIGFLLLFALLIYANMNDILRAFVK